MGPCNLSTIVPNLQLQYSLILSLLDCYVDTIFVLPNLGTAQGECPLSGELEIVAYFPQLTLLIGLKVGKTYYK